jgi:hypothetical protein
MITACFYSYQESCIIDGSVKDKKLIIHSLNFYENASIQNIGNLLKSRKNQIWINKHEPLKTVIPHARQFDIFGDDSKEMQALTDTWLDMKNTNRVELLNEFRLKDNEAQSNALKILLKSLTNELFKEPVNFTCMGVVQPRFKYQAGMRRR